MEFDPIKAGQEAKAERALQKARHYKQRKSKLEPFRFEIVQMYTHGISLELIQIHLKRNHGQSAHRSTILRYLQTLGVTRNG